MNLIFVVIVIAIIYLSEKKVDTKVLVGLGVGGVVLVAASRMEGAAGTCGGTGTAAVGTPATCTAGGGTVDAACTFTGTDDTKAVCVAKKTGGKACVFKAASTAADATCTGTPTPGGPGGTTCTGTTAGACMTGCTFKAATVAYAAAKPCAGNITETACTDQKCKWSAIAQSSASPSASPSACPFYQEPSPSPGGAGSTCENDWTIIIGSLVIVAVLVGGISYAALSKGKK